MIYGIITDEVIRDNDLKGYGFRDLDTNEIKYISKDGLVRKVLNKEIYLSNYKVVSNQLVEITETIEEEEKEDVIYNLMNKDEVIGEFGLYFKKFKSCGKLPYGFEYINTWINERLMISCARDSTRFFKEQGLSGKRALIENSHCISLHDNFWVKEQGSLLSWADVSPWRRERYSEKVGTHALEDNLLKIREDSLYSPVIGEEGSFPHKIEKRKNGVYFIKGSSKYTYGGVNCGNEPYSEYFAYKVCEYLKFDSVKYEIEEHLRNDKKIDIITICKYFTTEDIGSIPASALGLRTYKSVVEYCEKLSDKALKKCLDMLFLDCLLLNLDRHFNNIKFFIANDTLEVLDITPIFDNNYSLLTWFMPEYDKFVRDSYETRDGSSFEELYKLILKHKSYKEELEKLKEGFKFKASRNVRITKVRLDFVNKFLSEQIEYWLKFEEKNKTRNFGDNRG